MAVQHRTLAAVRMVSGPWQGDAPPLDSPAMKEALNTFEAEPRDALLYMVQALQQDELSDARMARAIVLKKAIQWGLEARRRLMLEELFKHMATSGEIEGDYKLSPEYEQTLIDLIKERKESASTSYEQGKITEVLEWVADPERPRAKGPEKRRIRALLANYEKRLFFGREKKVLANMAGQWQEERDQFKTGLVRKFYVMIDGKHIELDEKETEFCRQEGDKWENLYLEGRTRLTEVATKLVSVLVEKSISLDHPHIWDLVNLLHARHPEARNNLAKAVRTLEGRKYTLIYLREFVLRDQINPVMAVETVRLTKDEHEQLLREENVLRRLMSIELLEQIGKDYRARKFEIQGIDPAERDKFVKEKVFSTLEAVLQDKQVGARAQKALDDLGETVPDAK